MDRALSSFSKLRQKSSKDLSGSFSSREYPSDPACYELLEDCGRGVSATVHRAACMATNEIVAVKKMNLERVSMSLEEIIHEAQTMKSYHHPNVLPLFTSFVHGQDLWMVTPFMSGGSVLHIMKYRFPKGLDEVSIATVMKYVLLGLEYVHKNGGIHRDVKAGNILMDRDGTVRLGDFGVAATPNMRDGDWKQDKQQRTTFVGTPCWMAPEVMEQAEYNSKADIWSFGITLLELANGHAPFAKFPPMKVLLMTLQGPAPQLDDQPGKPHFSKLMRNVIARCLQKDPTQRPTATDLLQDKFFKQARDEDYLVRTLLNELPALGERVQMIREGKAATNAAENDRQLERSQEEYKRGVSMWNFDVSALKAQAALQDDGGLASIAEEPSAAAEGAGGGDGSGSSSRRSTDDAASLQQPAAAAAGVASPPAAAQAALPAAAAALPPVATSAAAAAAAAIQQEQQQPVELVQQQLPALQVPPTLQNVASIDQGAAHTQQQLQQVQQQQAATEAAATVGAQQQQQSSMRRAASAFAGSHALAAAAADMGGGGGGGAGGSSGNGGSSSSSAPGLASHYSEPAVSQQQQQHSSLPPPAPYAGAAYTGLSSGSLAGAGASSGGSSYCLSPPNTSPPMSRESSSQGPLSSLTTPEALQLRGKSKGRFQVYEHGVQAPPLSPGATRTSGPLQEGLSGSFTRGTTPTAAAAAAAAMAAAGGVASASTDSASAPLPAAVPLVPRMSDSTGQTTETPRAGRQLNATEAAELKAAAVAATAAAGTNGDSNAGAAAAQSGAPAAAGATPPAAAGGDAAAAAAAGTTANTSTCPTPPPGSTTIAAAAFGGSSGSGLNLPGMATGGTASVDAGDGAAAAAAGAAPSAAAAAAAGGVAPEPKKKGRFKIIEEDGPSRGPSKVSSSADLRASASSAALAAAAAGGGGSSQRGMLGSSGSVAAVLPELLRLHEQSVSHANSLARVIDGMRASCSGGNLSSAEDLMLLGSGGVLASVPSGQQAAAAGGGALPPRKPAAGAAGAGGGVLSRANSTRLLVLSGAEGGVGGGGVRGVVSLQQLLQESNGDAMDVAEKLFERVQDLERQVSSLEVELGRGLSRTPDYVRLKPLDGTTPTTASSSTQISAAPSGVPADLAAIATTSSADPSRATSRRTSVANLALSAASPTAAAAAAAASNGGSNGGVGTAAAGLVERHSSSGTSGGGGAAGGGNGAAAGAESGSGGGAAQPQSAAS